MIRQCTTEEPQAPMPGDDYRIQGGQNRVGGDIRGARGKGVSYTQDCSVIVPGDAAGSAVMAYALDPVAAQRL